MGRTAELEALVETVSRATVGGPVAAFVVGDPGVGKSRLLAEASRCVDVPYRFSVVGTPRRGYPSHVPERAHPRQGTIASGTRGSKPVSGSRATEMQFAA